MPKQAQPPTKTQIPLNQFAQQPLYSQLYERLRTEILEGLLEAGERLPSTRALAAHLGVSRNTVALAYELLQLEGYIDSRVGDGTRVSVLPSEHLTNVRARRAAPHMTSALAPTATSTERPQAPSRPAELIEGTFQFGYVAAGGSGTKAGVFRVGEPDVTHFPYRTWARLVARRARGSLQAVSLYQNSQGYLPLRQAIAKHVSISRGVRCSPDQIIVTAGSQGALDLIARVLLDRSDEVWIEDPGYFGARGALLSAGAQLVSVPVDDEGLDLEAGWQLSRFAESLNPEVVKEKEGPKVAVVTPSHQFPTGITMSLNRRLALLDWARETQVWIVEDDYDSEYRFSGRPLETLQGLDSAACGESGGRVIYVGTFSKVLFPSLRLGYLIAPPQLVNRFTAARRFIDVHPPVLEQMALADFIVEGHFGRHIRKMRLLYLERRNALIEVLTRELGDKLEVAVPEAGMHLVGWFRADIPGTKVRTAVRAASAKRLHVSLVSQYSQRPLPRDGLILGFASASAEELRVGVRHLALALQALD